mmetsp:Transcript_8136/g.23200  ORF Transcript_8136/g.23200 Transcript_8136/m.23200 type:complete len:148 (-) Transcript_8136:132-575(-)
METYWLSCPQFGKSNEQLWEHEWSKRGTCSGLDQLAYFQKALDLHAAGVDECSINTSSHVLQALPRLQLRGGVLLSKTGHRCEARALGVHVATRAWAPARGTSQAESRSQVLYKRTGGGNLACLTRKQRKCAYRLLAYRCTLQYECL